ncbi:MAG: YicC family protein [Firmicutes bacterium]|nr:YicC family protein [Bacillota bacterium]
MIKSMTGFGRGEAQNQHYAVQIELKSVNHRYLDLFIRLPKQYNLLEEPLRAAIQGRIARGRVEVMVNVEEFGEQERIVGINEALLGGYLQALKTVQATLGSTEQITLDQILSLPDVLEIKEPEVNLESLQEVFLEATHLALDDLENMRQVEGQRLTEDLLKKTLVVEGLLDQVKEVAPLVVVDYRNRLQERLGELLDGTNITEERFLGEVAIFADRCSIDEELVRLSSHIQQLKGSLRSDQSVGRKLDFLIQEMNREVNTIGSKANNLQIASLVVEMKSELEKIREQVQNIE